MQSISMKKLAMGMAVAAVSITAGAQNPTPNIYMGLGVGFHSNTMKFSDLDSKMFPSDESMGSGVLSVFGEIDFLKNHSLAIRPQFSYLRRGGKLTDIDKDNWTDDIEEAYYKMNAAYLDFRVPVLYQFGNDNSRVRPYLGVAPIVGFVTGGDVSLMVEDENRLVGGYRIDLNQGNMLSTYLAVAPTVGLKIHFPVRGLANACFLGLEASYEIGLTDTYGKDKSGDAKDVVANRNYKLAGTRKFSGFELNATVGIPLSIFEPKTEQPKAVPVPLPAPVVPQQPVAKTTKPCYTLEEIDDMIDNHESVIGKTICAVDAINFDFNKSTIKRESYPYLQRLAKTLSRTGAKIEVKGHTDNVGNDKYNMELSKKRAKAVHDYLIRLGVNSSNLTYSYYGASQPLTDNDTDENRTMNRRVEFEILK